MRRLRIPAPAQLSLTLSPREERGEELWSSLPEEARAEALSLLAVLVTRGVIDETPGDGEEEDKGVAR